MLRQIFPDEEVLKFILSDFASALAGEVTEHMNILHGESGSNGKSMLMHLMETSLGELATSWSTSLLKQDFDVCAPNPELANGKDKRIINIQEGKKDGTLNMETFKKIVGGDPINARKLYSNGSKFIITARIWMCLNTLPVIQDTDGGTWRRFRIVECNSKFVLDEKLVDHDNHVYLADTTLKKRIKDFCPAFLSLLIDSYNGATLSVPAAVESATEKYKRSQDVYGLFFESELEQNTLGKIHMNDLWSRCNTWASAEGYSLKRLELIQWLKHKGYYKNNVHIFKINKPGVEGFSLKIPDYLDGDEEELD
jgi:putative DNA primase/helicase